MSATTAPTIIHATECVCHDCEKKRSVAATTHPLCGFLQSVKMVPKTETIVAICGQAYDFVATQPAGVWKASNGFSFCAGSSYVNEYRLHMLYLDQKVWRHAQVVVEDVPAFPGQKKLLVKDSMLLKEALTELAKAVREQPVEDIFDGIETM